MKKLLLNALLLFLPLFFCQCATDDDIEKVDYNGELKYFTNQYGVEHFIENDYNSGAYITLPECFTKDYSPISITNEYNFGCFDNKVFFSIDAIPKEKINYYAEYFNDEKTKSQDGIFIMRDYCIETRANRLIEESKSIYSNIVSDENIPIQLGSVKGKSEYDAKELYYQFGVIETNDTFYILQAIMSIENVSFLHQDILKIFKSIKVK